jgi:cell division protein FtsB
MSLARAIKVQARAAIAPSIFLLLFGYFAWSATQGDRGLKASAQLRSDLVAAQAEQKRSEDELVAWHRRVAALRTTRLDTDALDERARAMLNLSLADDIIVPIRPGEHAP